MGHVTEAANYASFVLGEIDTLSPSKNTGPVLRAGYRPPPSFAFDFLVRKDPVFPLAYG